MPPLLEQHRIVASSEHCDLFAAARAGSIHDALHSAEQRHQAEGGFHESESGRGAADDEIAGQGDLESATEREAVDGGDGGKGHALESFEDGGRVLGAAIFGSEPVDVGSGREVLHIAAEQDRAGAGVCCALEGPDQLVDEGAVEQVVRWLGHRDHRDGAVYLEPDMVGGVGHEPSLPGARLCGARKVGRGCSGGTPHAVVTREVHAQSPGKMGPAITEEERDGVRIPGRGGEISGGVACVHGTQSCLSGGTVCFTTMTASIPSPESSA